MNASAFTSPFVHSTSSPHVPGILAYFATYRQSLSLRQHRLGYEKFYLHTVFAVWRAVFQGDFVWRPGMSRQRPIDAPWPQPMQPGVDRKHFVRSARNSFMPPSHAASP